MCTGEEGRERKGTLTSKAGGGGGQGVVSTKILWEQKITPPRAVIKRRRPGFFPGYFHRETEEKYNLKKSLAVWFPTYLILPGNLKS